MWEQGTGLHRNSSTRGIASNRTVERKGEGILKTSRVSQVLKTFHSNHGSGCGGNWREREEERVQGIKEKYSSVPVSQNGCIYYSLQPYTNKKE